jgi:transposase InsO family protein
MALRVMSVTDVRLEVLLEAARSGETVTAICKRFEISRETYYVYLRRFRAEGVEGLEPRSRQPINQPQRMPVDVEERIAKMRKDHPKWGARRIRSELKREGVDPPAVSSIHRALVRNHLVALSPSRPRRATQRFERSSPNDLWQIDATRLLLADDTEVWVMDILDDHARFCLAARVGDAPTTKAAWACFEWAIRRYGLPAQVLSDNGVCFTGRLIGGEVEFERRLGALGVETIHSRPYHPQTCGKLERFHRTMKEWLAEHPRAKTPEELQDLLDAFRPHYNEERPHQGIDDATPAERFNAGDIEPVTSVPAVRRETPAPRGAILRKVSAVGNLCYRTHMIQVGSEWNLHRLRVIEIDGVVHLFSGDQLVRALVLDPEVHYYPIVRKKARTGRARRQRQAKNP